MYIYTKVLLTIFIVLFSFNIYADYNDGNSLNMEDAPPMQEDLNVMRQQQEAVNRMLICNEDPSNKICSQVPPTVGENARRDQLACESRSDQGYSWDPQNKKCIPSGRNPNPSPPERDIVNTKTDPNQQKQNSEKQTAQEKKEQDQELNGLADEDLKICKKDYESASKCCMSPMKCITDSQTAADGFALAAGLGTAFGSASMMNASATNNPGQMQAICNAMKLASLGTAGANVGLGAVCSNAHNKCEDICGAKLQEWEARKSQYPGQSTIINRTIAELSNRKMQCGGLAKQAQMLVTQGASTGLAASMFDQCKQLTAQSNSGFENMNMNRNVNCADPAYANSPYCANCAANPANPYCQSMAPSAPVGTVGTISTRSVNPGGSQQFNVDTVGDGSRQLSAGGGDTQAAKAQSVPNNSGGGIPGGAGGNLQGGPDGRNQGPGAKPSADILQGERSGGGYSGGSFGGDGGGFAGYGSGGGGNSFSNSLKGFDLKKYLPGNEKDPAARKLAAVGDPSKVINGKHGNIFADLTRRIILICAQDRLMDCDRSRNSMAKPGDSL